LGLAQEAEIQVRRKLENIAREGGDREGVRGGKGEAGSVGRIDDKSWCTGGREGVRRGVVGEELEGNF